MAKRVAQSTYSYKYATALQVDQEQAYGVEHLHSYLPP